MKTLGGSLLLLSSLSLVAIGCADEADDLTAADEALLTCNGAHGNAHRHIGHRHHRHHHGHGQPHATGMGGSTGTGGSTGMAGTTGMAGAGGSGGAGGSAGAPVDPRCAPLDGIVSWWHGDGDYDDAVGSNDGTTGGNVSFTPGIDNQAFSLSGGPGAFVLVPNDPSLQITGSITIDAWINQPALGGRIVDKATSNDGYMLDVVADRLRMFIGTDAVLTPANALPAGMWVHVAGVFNGNGLGVYLNGALSAESVTNGHAIISNDMPVHIGADATGSSIGFFGDSWPLLMGLLLFATQAISYVTRPDLKQVLIELDGPARCVRDDIVQQEIHLTNAGSRWAPACRATLTSNGFTVSAFNVPTIPPQEVARVTVLRRALWRSHMRTHRLALEGFDRLGLRKFSVTHELARHMTIEPPLVELALPTTRWLGGGHETGRLEPPSQPPAGDIVHPEFGKLCLVLPCGPNVDDEQPTARAQHPYRFADCFLPAGTPANVVDREV
jgi:hypothetical protein